MTQKVEISQRTIIFTVVLLLSIWFVYHILDILILLFVSYVLMTAMRPLVDGLVKLKIPRVISIVVVYFAMFGFIGLSFASTVPAIIDQFSKLMQELPVFIGRLLPNAAVDINTLTQQITPLGSSVVRFTVSIFSNVFSLLPMFGFTFYLLLERHEGEQFIVETLGEEIGGTIRSVVNVIEQKLRWWVQGELALMLVIGILVYIGLLILRVDYALPLAILAGLLEIVPVIGPVISAIPAILVAWGTNVYLAVPVIALYVIVQQIENNIVVPIVMKKSVGMSPLVTILALMIGNRFGGMLGAILAVPFVLVLQVVVGIFMATNGSGKSAAKQKIADIKEESSAHTGTS